MKRIFVCTPIGEEFPIADLYIAKGIVAYLLRNGDAPFSSYVFYNGLIKEINAQGYHSQSTEKIRQTVMSAGRRFLPICDEMLVYAGKGLTNQMKGDMDDAEKFGVPINKIIDISQMMPTLDNPFVELELIFNPHKSICAICETDDTSWPQGCGASEEIWAKHRNCLREGRSEI